MTQHSTDASPSPEPDEHFLREVLDVAMSGTRPPLDLPSGALARGRRLRTRRRVGVASMVVAASVLAAATVPLVLGSGDASTGDNVVATQPPAPDPVEAPAGWWDMPSAEMVTTVEAILPDGVTVDAPGPLTADTPEGGPAKGWITPLLGSTTGPGSLNVILNRDLDAFAIASDDPMPVTTDGIEPTCDGLAPSGTTPCSPSGEPSGPVKVMEVGAPYRISCDERFLGRTECVQIRDEDGTIIGRRLTNTWGGTMMNEVTLERDGGTVYAASANTLDEKWGTDSPLSAERPPMTLDELEALVRNDAWVSYQP